MPSRSNKSRKSSNASSTGKGWLSRRSSLSGTGRDTSRGGGDPQSPGTSPRIEAASSTSSSMRPNYYYNGLDLLNGSRRESDDSNVDGSRGSSLTLMNDEIPAIEFARAHDTRDAEFHELFPALPKEEYLIEDYGCALQREITIQGRIYITERNICFYSSIFGWITDFAIPISGITSLDKKSTAYFIPNAIQITTRHEKVTLSSFLSRDTTYDLLYKLWCLRTHPEDNGRWSADNSPEIKNRTPVVTAKVVPATVTPPPAVDASNDHELKITECTCGKEGKHYSEPVVDVVLAGTPEKILHLMLEKGFMMDFMSRNQKLLDIKMTEWAPITPDSRLLARELSYIKPLHMWVGPKHTKCELKEAMDHSDYDDFVSMVTTTRTPDIPSGHAFSVKTRTCIMWASATTSRVVVTTQVEWTGRSIVKGIIERSALDGVKSYLIDLVKAVRRHINQHKSNFMPEGFIDVPMEDTPAEPPRTPDTENFEVQSEPKAQHSTPHKSKIQATQSTLRRSDFQLALDTLHEASQLAWHGIEAAVERIQETYPGGLSTSRTIIIILAVANLWLLFSVSATFKRIDEKLGEILIQLESG